MQGNIGLYGAFMSKQLTIVSGLRMSFFCIHGKFLHL